MTREQYDHIVWSLRALRYRGKVPLEVLTPVYVWLNDNAPDTRTEDEKEMEE